MRTALAEAKKGLGLTSPNPAVGAVLVVRGKIVARGHHRKAGAPHAEIECLAPVRGALPKDAVLYVTLEPCSTTGRTPPCTNTILERRVRNVVVGALDPNPRHAGRGVAQLRAAGINVTEGVLAAECTGLNEAYNKWIRTGRPFVIVKCGMSLDGRLTRPPGESRWLTSAAARRHAQKLRAQVDAILIGAETLRQDDPQLTVRGLGRRRQPWRVVLSRSGKLPPGAKLLTDRHANRSIVLSKQSLALVLRELGKREITSVLIEGGGDILGQALDARLIDKFQVYLAPMMVGGPVVAFPGKGAATSAEALRLGDLRYEQIDDCVCVTGYADL